MIAAQNPHNETQRLVNLKAYDILDSAAEPQFDDLTQLASNVCGTPNASIGLMDSDRLWIKSKVGRTLEPTRRCQTLCGHAILGENVFEIPDILKDKRFRDNPFVTQTPPIRFYAGAPLISPEGYALGTLCVTDLVPRRLTSGQADALQAMSRQVVRLLVARRLVKELKHKQQLLWGVVDTIPHVLFWKDRTSTYLGCNRAFATAAGLASPEDVVGKSDYDLPWTPNESDSFRDADQCAIEKGIPLLDIEEVVRKADGVRRNILTSKVPLRDATGSIVGILGIYSDVTERHLAKHELIARELEARLLHRAATMASEPQSFESAMQRCLALICDATGWILGHAYVSSEEGDPRLIPTNLWYDTNDKAHEAFRAITENTVIKRGVGLPGRVLETGESVWIVDVRQHPTFPRAAAFCAAGLRGAFAFPIKVAGRCVAVLEFFRTEVATEDADFLQIIRTVAEQLGRVLELKRAEQALRTSEERFRLISKATNDAIWDWNLISNQLEWSDGFETLFGFARIDVEPTIESWTNRIHPNDLARVSTKVHAVIDRGGESYADEYRFRCKDGHYAYVLDRGHIIRNGEGKVVRMVGAMTDLTERKNAESMRDELNRQLQEVSRRAGMAEVATNVLHNVGNVLNSVNVSANIAMEKIRSSRIGNLARAAATLKTHAENLLEFVTADEKGKLFPAYLVKLAEYMGNEQGEVLKELTALTSNVEHIKEIVKMQQSYARVASVTEVIAAEELVEDALRLDHSVLERHQIQIKRDYVELPPLVTDKHKALQILVNLLHNVKYALADNAESNRRITLRIRASENNPDRIQIQVIDNGMGITPHNLTKMFAHGFTTRKDGHGFGLHSAALDAAGLGGSLVAYSDGPGTGATFTLELPRELSKVNS